MFLRKLDSVDPTPLATAVALLDHDGWPGSQKAAGAPMWRWLMSQAYGTAPGQVAASYPAATLGERMNLAAGLGDLPVYANAAAAQADGLEAGDLYRTPAGLLKAVPLDAVTVGVNPYHYDATGDGVADDTAAVVAAMTAVDAQAGAYLDLSGGTWRVTSALPTLTRPMIDGSGTGTLYADWALSAPILRLQPPVPANAVYTVTAIDEVADYDWFGAFTGVSRVTRLTVTLGPGRQCRCQGKSASSPAICS